AALKKFGRIDILVTCAGSSPGGLLEDLTEDQWMSSLNLKFMGYVRSVRAVIEHMRERGEGSIVLVVGNDGLKPSYWEMTAGVAAGGGHQRCAHTNRRCPAQSTDGHLRNRLELPPVDLANVVARQRVHFENPLRTFVSGQERSRVVDEHSLVEGGAGSHHDPR